MFNILTMNSVALRRQVEVFQWSERMEEIRTRQGNQVRVGKKYNYTAEWSRNFRDSSNYADPKYKNTNIRPSV